MNILGILIFLRQLAVCQAGTVEAQNIASLQNSKIPRNEFTKPY